MLVDLNKESEKAKKKEKQVEAVTVACQKQAEQIETEAAQAEKELEAAMPALIRAQKAVDDLTQADVVELKSNKAPADVIKYIIDSVVIFF